MWTNKRSGFRICPLQEHLTCPHVKNIPFPPGFWFWFLAHSFLGAQAHKLGSACPSLPAVLPVLSALSVPCLLPLAWESF